MRTIGSAIASLGLGLLSVGGARAAATSTWQRWEAVLHSQAVHANPYADVTLGITYTGPGGLTIHGYGFWDGGDVFRIRCAFPRPGLWRWHTECSDAGDRGLHDRSGQVRVSPYTGANPLYRHGFLRVSDNHRYLSFADRTPFLWVGDTAWVGPMRATDPEWSEYLEDRAAKGFTLTQVGPAPWWAGKTDRAGQPPFLGDGIRQWNPVFWQGYERRIQMANDAGFAVPMVGAMEPTTRYPEAADACLFARNIVARLFGSFVIFSPSFDSGYMDLGNEVGQAIREATSVHLITQHPGTTTGHSTNTIAEAYFDQPYLDFAGDQTGHNGGRRDLCASQAANWNLHLYGREPPKPVINLETMYDTGGEDAFNADDARSLAYRSWLSGAMGYTYGTDLYQWITDPAAPEYWRKALALPSSTQMRYLRDLLASLHWWELEPAHERLLGQPDDPVVRAALAQTRDGRLALAYVPSAAAVRVSLDGLKGPLNARWFNPRSGQHAGAASTVPAAGEHSFTPPEAGDWVLVLRG